MSTALYIGRFQPFHLGHLSVIEKALTHHDTLIIGVGSSQYSNTPDNPYSFEERRAMIRAALDEATIPEPRTPLIALPDIHNPSRWVTHVKSIMPHFDTIVTGSPIVNQLFQEEGNTTIETTTITQNVRATRIRMAMAQGQEWKHMVPPAVFNYLTTQKNGSSFV